MEGILLVNKPKGPTSFQIIKTLRKITGERKVGHAGTLDPGARGLLVVLIGRATKYAQYVERMNKCYVARILLGVRTDTDDREGTIIERNEGEALTDSLVRRTLAAFIGTISQKPPRYSAVKHCGRRAYELARRGKDFDLKPREIAIHDLRMIYYRHPFIKVSLSCSKGTYVRSIARDVGDELGTGATLHSLVRTRVGAWSVAQSLYAGRPLDSRTVAQRVVPVEKALFGECSGVCGQWPQEKVAAP